MTKPYIRTYDTPHQIPDRAYDGYIWFSNNPNPYPFCESTYPWKTIEKNPFIIEGLLYHKSETAEISISIRHTGKYHIKEFDLKKLPKESSQKEVAYLLSKRLEKRLEGCGIKKLKFQQLWLPEKDPLCADMEVLKVKTLLFMGFECRS